MNPAYQVMVRIPLDEAPQWLSHLDIVQEGDEIVIEVVKENGTTCGEARFSASHFNDMADLVLTQRRKD